MKLPNFNFFALLASGFNSALSTFLKQQELRDMALADKLNQILQNQQTSDATLASINDVITSESAQVNDAIAKLTETTSQLVKTVEEQKEEIKQLLSRVEEGDIDLTEAENVIDQILQKQQEQIAAQQEATSKISAIFNAPVEAVDQPVEVAA